MQILWITTWSYKREVGLDVCKTDAELHTEPWKCTVHLEARDAAVKSVETCKIQGAAVIEILSKINRCKNVTT